MRSRPWVRRMVRSCGFPLADPLPSTPSAPAPAGLFGGFPGTMGPSDFPCPYIIGVCPWTSRCGPLLHRQRAAKGSPGFRTGCLRACAGSLTARGPEASRDIDAPGVAFRISLLRRHPEVIFRGSMAGLHVPLSTLPHALAGRRGMTRSRCGSLNLQRMKLSFTTTCRRDRRFQGGRKNDQSQRALSEHRRQEI